MTTTPQRPDRASVIKVLLQLRTTLAHAIRQPNIGPARFDEIREQLIPLDLQLHDMGVTDVEVLPQLAPTYVKPTRHQRRVTQRKRKSATYSQKTQWRLNAGAK